MELHTQVLLQVQVARVERQEIVDRPDQTEHQDQAVHLDRVDRQVQEVHQVQVEVVVGEETRFVGNKQIISHLKLQSSMLHILLITPQQRFLGFQTILMTLILTSQVF